MPRRAAKVDDNQQEIVEALRMIGASVTATHAVGAGFPDLVVGYRGNTFLIEVKDGSKSPSRRKLTPDQQRWHDAWRGQVAVVNNVDEAFEAIGANAK